MTEDIWQTEKMIPRSTGAANAWPKQAICGRNRHIKIHIRRHLTTTRHEWWLAPLQLHIKVIQRNWMKLWDLQLRTTGNHLSTHWVVTLPARIPTPDHNSVRGCSHELSTWYSTLVLLSRPYLITFPHLLSHADLSLFNPYLCSIAFLDVLSDRL